jgi:osmotically-inducible protein OsmY
MITDSGIQQDIEKELSWDPAVSHKHVAVTVKNGAAVLIGDVISYWEKCAAERAAWRIAHVKSVTNSLRVDLPFASERNDDDIALAAMSILEWNCIVPASVEVQVAGSWVTLSGIVPWHYQKEEAERALCALTGMKGIKNQIELQPAPTALDVRVPIDEAIKRSALVDSSHVKAHASHGTVSLRGAVRTRAEHMEAMHAAWAAPGVTQVEDHIGIGG